nr:putative N-acetylated-alpha-linked acidic dipeptidase isoform X2 [Geotrypetes seraphini]
MGSTTPIKVFGAILGCIALFVIGIVIGRFALAPEVPSWLHSMSNDGDPSNSQRLMKEIQAENIRKNLEFFTKKPHIAGSEQDEITLVNHIREEWESYLDGVRIHTYNVLLSYPNASDPNYVAMQWENGTETEQSAKKEKILSPDQEDPNVVNPFNAYSPAGDILGDLVYVNYGTVEDFLFLTRNLSMNLTGKVAIVRYGKIFRGDKVKNGEKYGCVGMIIYSDPADYVVGSTDRVFPDDWWLPGTGAQRGSVLTSIVGDPLTPFYPSIESAYYLDEKEICLPLIPVTPIGYDDAIKYLSKMDGNEVQSSWRGKLNITYRFGPGFRTPHEKSKIKLYVQTYNVKKPIKNIIGFIKGVHEPDRYVVLGNHRDAWVFGAIDPSSGTATMMEVSRAMGQLLKDGWRPRRSIIFCSWGAEEYSLIGSTEWVEEMNKILGSRAVAYLNVDLAIEGNTSLVAHGTPVLHNLIYEASKKVENPNPEEIAKGRRMVYDTWLETSPSAFNPKLPHIGDLGSGSDYAPFLQNLGISSIDIRYTYDKTYLISSYPMYHSVYETFNLVSQLMDRDFKYHQAVARIWGVVALTLADSVLLTFDCKNYASALERILASVQTNYGALFLKNGISLDNVTKATEEFKKAASALHKSIETLDIKNPLNVRRVNDQLMQLERAFIDPLGIAGDATVRHVIYAPNQHDIYASSSFPGLEAALFDIENQTNQTESWKKVKKEISIITFTILSAASTLKEVTDIGGLYK